MHDREGGSLCFLRDQPWSHQSYSRKYIESMEVQCLFELQCILPGLIQPLQRDCIAKLV